MGVRVAGCLALLWLGVVAACGGGSPVEPSPSPSSNAPPIVTAIVSSVTQAEVGDTVTFTASVTDAETPVSQLIFEWTATQGTISGTGTTVQWKPPETGPSPADHRVRLTVVERFGSPQTEHRVSADSPVVRVYNSQRDLSELALTFLTDFATSSVSAIECVRNFSGNCAGKDAELADIERNRLEFVNLAHELGTPGIAIDTARTSALISVSCNFLARNRATGVEGWARGTCRLTAVREDLRWLLCSSNFDPLTSVHLRFGF